MLCNIKDRWHHLLIMPLLLPHKTDIKHNLYLYCLVLTLLFIINVNIIRKKYNYSVMNIKKSWYNATKRGQHLSFDYYILFLILFRSMNACTKFLFWLLLKCNVTQN